MTPHTFLHPQRWKRPKGYANGIAAEGRLVFLAGQIGWNAEQRFESADFIAQARQALANVVALVREAGGYVSDFLAGEGLDQGGPILACAPGVKEALLAVAEIEGLIP